MPLLLLLVLGLLSVAVDVADVEEDCEVDDDEEEDFDEGGEVLELDAALTEDNNRSVPVLSQNTTSTKYVKNVFIQIIFF